MMISPIPSRCLLITFHFWKCGGFSGRFGRYVFIINFLRFCFGVIVLSSIQSLPLKTPAVDYAVTVYHLSTSKSRNKRHCCFPLCLDIGIICYTALIQIPKRRLLIWFWALSISQFLYALILRFIYLGLMLATCFSQHFFTFCSLFSLNFRGHMFHSAFRGRKKQVSTYLRAKNIGVESNRSSLFAFFEEYQGIGSHRGRIVFGFDVQ